MLLHIGYHKTATTWLQQRVFAHPATGFEAPWTTEEVIARLVRPHPLEWDKEEARGFFEQRRRATESSGRVPLLSNEELAGNPHSGAFNNTIIAERLASLFPGARVLLVIRRQPPLLASMYKQYVARGGVLPPRRYFTPPADAFRVPAFRLRHLEYHRLIELYHRLFGAERVLVLTMEAMVEDRAGFVRAVSEHAGARPLDAPSTEIVRASRSAATTALQRQLNRWLLRDDVNPAAPFRLRRLPAWMGALDPLLARGPGRIVERRLGACVEDLARGRYGASNRRTANLTGLDLAQAGYDVGS